MADKAVQYKFNDYLAEAKSALYFTWMSYNLAATDYPTVNEIYKIYNTHLEQITIVEYMNNRGAIPADKYLETYVSILNDVIYSGSTYYGLVAADTAAKNLEAMQKAVKSYGKTNVTAGEGWYNLLKPVAAYTGAPQYFAFGTAAVDFDREINKNAVEKKADGTVKTAHLY
jgi:hypothetical protein